MRLFCILAGAAMMIVGLSGCDGGGIQEGVEPNVDMSKTYTTPASGDMSGMTKGKPWLKKQPVPKGD